MKNLSKKFKILILTIILIIISALFIIINGNTYTIEYDNLRGIEDIKEFNIKIEDENIAKCTDKYIENGVLKVKIESKSEGKTYIVSETFGNMYCIYVHKFGIITFNEYIGDCNGSIIIPISIITFLSYVLFILITSYKQNIKINMYQYKNITYLGMAVFITFTIITQIFALFNYRGLISTINDLLSMFSFATLLLPVAFVISIFVILSNIALIRKEGFNFRNTLGIALGGFLCFSTILPELMNQLLYSATWIDIHNQNGIDLYIYDLIETIIYISITYIECILIIKNKYRM